MNGILPISQGYKLCDFNKRVFESFDEKTKQFFINKEQKENMKCTRQV